MNVGQVIEELKQYNKSLDVYIRKSDFFGNVGYVFHVSQVKHPIFNTDCIVLRDDAPYEVYYFDDDEVEDKKATLGACYGCENYEECKGCDHCEHVAERFVTTLGYGGFSNWISEMTVEELISALEKMDQNADLMTKPRGGEKNFCDVNKIEVDSYAFFGMQIPCVYVAAN